MAYKKGNYGRYSHTVKYLSKVICKVGVNKIVAIVSYNAVFVLIKYTCSQKEINFKKK